MAGPGTGAGPEKLPLPLSHTAAQVKAVEEALNQARQEDERANAALQQEVEALREGLAQSEARAAAAAQSAAELQDAVAGERGRQAGRLGGGACRRPS